MKSRVQGLLVSLDVCQAPSSPRHPLSPALPSSPPLMQLTVLWSRDCRLIVERKEANYTQTAFTVPGKGGSTTQHRCHYHSSSCHPEFSPCSGLCVNHPPTARVAQPLPCCLSPRALWQGSRASVLIGPVLRERIQPTNVRASGPRRASGCPHHCEDGYPGEDPSSGSLY